MKRGNRLLSWAGVMVQFTVVSFVFLIGVTAILSGVGRVKLPYELFVLDQRLPLLFRIHMAASGLAMILITVALLLHRRAALHRLVGRAAVVAVVLGGLTALPSAVMSAATPMARAGFFVQACIWLALLAAGIAAIRTGDVIRHRQLMSSMAAVASGAIWLRVATLITAAAQLPFEMTYAVAAWASWLVPLVLVRLSMRGQEPTRSLPGAGRGFSP